MRLIPGGGRTWVYDSRCNDWREVHSSRDCPMAYRFGTYESLLTMPWQTILQTLCIKLTSTTQEAIDSA